MKRTLFSLAALALAAHAVFAAEKSGAVVREAGAIYLEDLVTQPVRLAVKTAAPAYFKSDMARYLGSLHVGQTVELQAVGDKILRVRGRAQQGQVAGWVDAKHLQALKPEFITSLKQNAQRKAEVAAMIERNEVGINMTPEEVTASLGKPAKKSSKVDAAGQSETWEFVRYERVPQQISGYDKYGRLVTQTVLTKVPNGKLTVSFASGLVSALEQTEGSIESAARVKIIPAPCAVVF